MASKIAQKLMKEVPAGFRLLSEGKANVLYHIKDDKQKDVEMTSDQKGKKISKVQLFRTVLDSSTFLPIYKS